MSLINEYIDKKMGIQELETELLGLIAAYNKHQSTYLFVYAAALEKPIPDVQLQQSDYYLIRDLLTKKKKLQKLDVYLETPGGSGETAEEIVRFLRDKFDTVNFVIAGEAKSAGTIMALSGDEIWMSETGSLGPIDAQMRIGRSVVSAYDYMEWINKRRKEAQKKSRLNPFDATMVAQITPGELGSVNNSLKFAEDLVVDWLTKYKFRNWSKTETRQKPVTQAMKKKRAGEIARELTNHVKWRSHGRSIKIFDLEKIGLKIQKIDADEELAEIVYRIQVVCRMIFESTTSFKIFATEDNKIFRQAVPAGTLRRLPSLPQVPNVVQIEQKCPKCGQVHKLYGKFEDNAKIDEDMKNQGFFPFPKDSKLKCTCGYEIDLTGIRNQIELQSGQKLVE